VCSSVQQCACATECINVQCTTVFNVQQCATTTACSMQQRVVYNLFIEKRETSVRWNNERYSLFSAEKRETQEWPKIDPLVACAAMCNVHNTAAHCTLLHTAAHCCTLLHTAHGCNATLLTPVSCTLLHTAHSCTMHTTASSPATLSSSHKNKDSVGNSSNAHFEAAHMCVRAKATL